MTGASYTVPQEGHRRFFLSILMPEKLAGAFLQWESFAKRRGRPPQDRGRLADASVKQSLQYGGAWQVAHALLEVHGLTKRFGAVQATDALDLAVLSGEVHALIGPNGAGKTTLLSQLAGELAPDAGTIHFAGRDITALPAYQRANLGIARSFQLTSIFPDLSVLENALLAVQARAAPRWHFWRPRQRFQALRQEALQALHQVGLAARAAEKAASLSHGEQRQLDLAMALATSPTLLLLDEPTAGMSQEESVHIVSLLRQLRGQYTILLVEHDMDVVFRLADRITVLVYGQVLATDTPAAIRAHPEVRQAYLGTEDDLVC